MMDIKKFFDMVCWEVLIGLSKAANFPLDLLVLASLAG